MFVNLSNHPIASWSKKQLDVASKFGEPINIPFPNINPRDGEAELRVLCDIYLDKIHEQGNPENLVIHLMGEMSFTFLLLSALMNEGYRCVASTSERIVKETDKGVKEVLFEFVGFRDYIKPF